MSAPALSATPADWQIAYLLVFPIDQTTQATAVTERQPLKDSPYFQPVDIAVRHLGGATLHVEGVEVRVQPQIYDDLIEIVELHYALPDLLLENGRQRKMRLDEALQRMFLPAEAQANGLWEEYTVSMLSQSLPNPEAFVAEHSQPLSRFIRSENVSLNPLEIEQILFTRLRYAPGDLAIIDWEGAILIAADGDFRSELALFKIGNYQLLRYRMLDRRIETRLEGLQSRFGRRRSPAVGGFGRRDIRQIIEERLSILLDYERIDQNLLMIGDWYTAKLYRAIIDEYYLDEWKQMVKDKLENLESIVQVMQENFSISWSSLIDIVQLAGWLLLLIGYFVLFYFDTIAYLAP